MKHTLVLLAFLVTSAHAQIVKSFSLSGNITGGNLKTFTARTAATLGSDSSRVAWSVSPSFVLALGPGYRPVSRESLITASASRRWGKWRVIGFAEGENSLVKRIRLRGSAGLGAGLAPTPGVNVSLALMPDFYYAESASVRDALSLRASLRFKYSTGKKTRFESITFVQPALASTTHLPLRDNLLIRSTADLTHPLNKRFSAGLQGVLDYDSYSAAVNNLKTLDWSVLFVLKWK